MKKILFAIAAVLAAVACIPDDRNNFMVPDRFGITGDGVKEASVHTGFVTLGINKSGKGQKAGSVTVLTGDECAQSIDDYNIINRTSYKPVDASLVTLDNSRVDFEADDIVKTVTLSWNPAAVVAAIGDDPDYVIPVVLTSEGLSLNYGHEFIMIHLNRSSMSIMPSSVTRTIEAKNVEADKQGNQPELIEEMTFDISITPAIDGVGLSMPVVIDNSLIAGFNETQDETFVAAPDGLVSIVDANAVIAEGSVGGTYKLKLDKGKLLSGGKLQEFPNYVIPVRVKSESISATKYGEAFELKGLSVGNMVTYITIKFQPTVKGLSVSRVWGKYSTAAASWNSYFGGIANSDRNFTMDDEYIYVPEVSETDANIWRIRINSPESVSKAAAPATPTGYFKIASVRMMDPGTPNMNGGKPMLIASNMVMTDGGPTLKLYIYDKGTDAAPSEWTMSETNLGRRLGDIFTTHGTFANGGFFFKDWNKVYGNGTILVWRTAFTSVPNYAQSPRNPTWNTIKDEGGRAAFYPYPGQTTPQKGIYTGTESAYYVSESGNNVYTWNASAFNATDAGGYYVGAGDFNFFEYKGKRYIAYVKNVSSTDGRLYVLEGDAGDDWQTILGAKRKVIFQACIQADVQFSDGEYHSELEVESPQYSGNSGIGCAVTAIGDEVFIMAGKQNVGLSLFKMSMNE